MFAVKEDIIIFSVTLISSASGLLHESPLRTFLSSLGTAAASSSKKAEKGGGRALTYTLTLFKTKIADFPSLFKTEFRFLIPCLRHLTRNHTLCKTIINKNFAVV